METSSSLHTAPSQRLSTAETIRRNTLPYDAFIVVLTIFSLGLTALIIFPGVPRPLRDIALAMDGFISVIFIYDFFRMLFLAPNKLQYLKWGWVDFLGSLPTVPALRWLRLARFVRAWRVLQRTSPDELLWVMRHRPAGSTLLLALLLVIVLLGISSYAMLIAELGKPNANIRTAQDAFWWAVVSVSTVGYGDHYPVTGEGRVIAVFLMFGGISLFSVLTGYLATTFTKPRDDEDMEEIRDRLDTIERLLQNLQAERAALPDAGDSPPDTRVTGSLQVR